MIPPAVPPEDIRLAVYANFPSDPRYAESIIRRLVWVGPGKYTFLHNGVTHIVTAEGVSIATPGD